jgi:L-malate glycosyltransferase
LKSDKVIFIHLLNDYSGSPKVLSQVINAVKNNNIILELYTGTEGAGFLSGVVDRHHSYIYKHFKNKYLTLLSFAFSQISLFFQLLKYRNENVVFYINTMLPFGAGLAGRLIGKPVYYHIHETSLRPEIFKRFLRYIVRKSASKVIFVSKALKKDEGFVKISQHVVHNALSSDFMNIALSNQYRHLIDGQFNVLMICSLKVYKGIYEFINIAFLCQREKYINFTMVLNASQSEIDSYFRAIEIPSNMILVPKQIDIAPFYQQASLVLNLSRIDEWIETFGLTIIEAMAFGIPVIAPPVGGPTEIVRDGVEGYLISSYEVKIISNKIIELSKDEKRSVSFSNSARKRAGSFQEEVFEKKIMDLIYE